MNAHVNAPGHHRRNLHIALSGASGASAAPETSDATGASEEAGEARPGGPRARQRIFVAVVLAPELREAIGGVRTLLGGASERLRWVPPENLHLTLKFLGEITPAQMGRVVEATREAAQGVTPFAVTLAGLGAFPTARRPRVVWVGVHEGSERLVALAGVLDRALGRRKFPGEARPFQAHLTVARARTGGPPPDLTQALAGAGAPRIGTQEVDALVVMESLLRPSGPIYQEVARERLQGGGC